MIFLSENVLALALASMNVLTGASVVHAPVRFLGVIKAGLAIWSSLAAIRSGADVCAARRTRLAGVMLAWRIPPTPCDPQTPISAFHCAVRSPPISAKVQRSPEEKTQTPRSVLPKSKQTKMKKSEMQCVN
jgi:hypothetical protein